MKQRPDFMGNCLLFYLLQDGPILPGPTWISSSGWVLFGEGMLFFLHASSNVQEEIQMLVKKNSKNPFLIDQNYTWGIQKQWETWWLCVRLCCWILNLAPVSRFKISRVFLVWFGLLLLKWALQQLGPNSQNKLSGPRPTQSPTHKLQCRYAQ